MTKRSYPTCSAALTPVTFTVPVLPPLASAHVKAGRLVPGGAGAGTGGGVIRGLDAAWIGVLVASATGVAEAVGPASPHAVRAMHKPSAAAVRTGQWYCRAP